MEEMSFRLLVVLCVTVLITTPTSTSNITTAHVTETDLPEDAVLGNVTRNGSYYQESLGIDSGDQNVDEISATDDHTEKMFKTTQSLVHRFYFPIATVLGAFSCITTIIVLQKNNVKTSAEVYITGIASANLMSIINYIIWDLNRFEFFYTNRDWQNIYSYNIAFIFPFVFIAMAANSWIIIAFAVERLLAIRYPFKALIICSKSRAVKAVICIYITALLTNTSRFFVTRVKVEVDPLTNETIHKWYHTDFGSNLLFIRIQFFFFSIAAVVVPVTLLGVFNIAILVNLRTLRRIQLGLKEGLADSDDNRNVQIERVLIAYTFAFFFCNVISTTTTGTVAVYGFTVFDTFSLEFEIRLLISSMLYILNSSVNFTAYVCCSRMYRETVKNYLCGLVCSAKKSPPVSSKCLSASDPVYTSTTEIQNTIK